MFQLYRDLIGERRGSPALRRGSYRSLPAPRGVFAYLREDSDERRLVLLNFGERTVKVPVSRVPPGGSGLRIRLSTDPARDPGAVGKTVELGPDEGVLIEA